MFKYPIPKAKVKATKKEKKKKKKEQENRYEQQQLQQQQQQQWQQQQNYHQPPPPPPPPPPSNYQNYQQQHPQTTDHLQQFHSQSYTPTSSGTPPSLHTTQNLSSWFDFFDTDRGGTLDREEVVRGLQRTLAGDGYNQSNPQTVRDTVYSVWCVFDHDGSGVIDRVEFCAAGGLGESLVAMVSSPSGGGGGGGGGGGVATEPIAEVEPDIEIMPSSSYDRQQFMGVPIPPGITPGRTMRVTLQAGDPLRNITVPEHHEWHYGSDGKPYFLTPTTPEVEVPMVQAMAVPPPAYVPAPAVPGVGTMGPVVPDRGRFSVGGGGGGGGGGMELPMPPPYNPNTAGYR